MNKAAMTMVILLLVAMWGCKAPSVPAGPAAGHGTEAETAKEEAPVMSRHAGVAQLPCFGCHSAGAFMNSTAPGVFSHKIHTAFDVHCSQCHDIKPHEHAKIISETCQSCHSLKALKFEGGGMGEVVFSHDFHSKTFPCSDCHTKLFPMKRGIKKLLMDDMYAGKSCGACHNGKRAFPSMDCANCHKQG